MEQFYEGQENRARILNSLYDKDLPVDVSQKISPIFSSLLYTITPSAFPSPISTRCGNWRRNC